MLKAIVILALGWTGITAHAGSVFVGNGGLGVEINGKLYSFDLFQAGQLDHPYVGEFIDTKLSVHPPAQLNLSQNMLERKLADLNQIKVGLGDAVNLTMSLYDWVLTSESITPTDSIALPIEIPANAKLTQIAIRLGNRIVIQKQAWDRLDDVNKVAMIVHEMLFALTTPRDLDTGSDVIQRPPWPADSHPNLAQLPLTAIELTGELFTQDLFAKNRKPVFSSQLTHLSFFGIAPAPKQNYTILVRLADYQVNSSMQYFAYVVIAPTK